MAQEIDSVLFGVYVFGIFTIQTQTYMRNVSDGNLVHASTITCQQALGRGRDSISKMKGAETFAPRHGADLRKEGTAHNFIGERDIKFAVAVNAEYVLARHMARSEVNSNVDLLLHFTAWAFNRHHDEARLLRHTFHCSVRCGAAGFF